MYLLIIPYSHVHCKLKNLSSPFLHMYAYITDTLTELTSLLDSLLSTTSQAKTSECSPIPAKETDAHADTQASGSDQSPEKTTASEHVQIKLPVASHTGDQPIPLPDSSHQEQVKDDSAHASDDTDHSDDKSEMSLTDSPPQKPVAHNANVQTKSLSDTHDQILMHTDFSYREHSTKEQTVVISGQTASKDVSTVSSTTNEPYQIMLRYNDKLITALSLDPQGISRILLAKELIPEHTEAQMQQGSGTSCEKAAILVTTVRQVIKMSPKRFHAFLDILAEQALMEDIVEELKSCIGDGSTQSHTKSSVPENNESLTILTYQDKLINAISADTLNVTDVLREHDFISDEVSGKILCPSSTAQEKATILVNAVKEKIKTAPKRFPELLRVLSEQMSTKDVAEMLQSAYQDKSKFLQHYRPCMILSP